MSKKNKELEKWKNVEYRMREEGFHYCFKWYSFFEEIEDEEFHQLRHDYIDAADKLENYIKAKVNVLRSPE